MQITGGKFKSRKLNSPKSGAEGLRPTLSKTRQAIFNSLLSIMDFEGKSFLDMFAGSGIMGIEAFSRGFSPIYTIEKDKKTFELAKSNYGIIKAIPKIIFGDALIKIKTINEKFDVIFIDPPYAKNLYNPSIEAILASGILKDNGVIILEHPKESNINFDKFEILKQKTYSSSLVTFLGLK